MVVLSFAAAAGLASSQSAIAAPADAAAMKQAAIAASPLQQAQYSEHLSLPEIKCGRTGDAILPGAAWQ